MATNFFGGAPTAFQGGMEFTRQQFQDEELQAQRRAEFEQQQAQAAQQQKAREAMIAQYGEQAGDPQSFIALQNNQRAAAQDARTQQAADLQRQQGAILNAGRMLKMGAARGPEGMAQAWGSIQQLFPALGVTPEQQQELLAAYEADPEGTSQAIMSFAEANEPQRGGALTTKEVIGPDGRPALITIDPQGNVTPLEGYAPLPKERAPQRPRWMQTTIVGDDGTPRVMLVDPDSGAMRDIGQRPATGKAGAKAGAQTGSSQGGEAVSNNLGTLAAAYLKLDELGGIVNPDRNMVSNLVARAGASMAGQLAGGAVGTEEQSIRENINNMRPLLINAIRESTGMSAKAMDSNKELEFYLQAATDPKKDIYSNLVAIDVLDRTYGLGGVLDDMVPPAMLKRVREQTQLEMGKRPLAAQPALPSGWSVEVEK